MRESCFLRGRFELWRYTFGEPFGERFARAIPTLCRVAACMHCRRSLLKHERHVSIAGQRGKSHSAVAAQAPLEHGSRLPKRCPCREKLFTQIQQRYVGWDRVHDVVASIE